MKPIFLVIILILVSVLFFAVGYKLYYSESDRFQDNIVPIVGILKDELIEIDNQLKTTDLPLNWSRDLLLRRSEVVSELNLFYGRSVYK